MARIPAPDRNPTEFKYELNRLKETLKDMGFVRDMYSTNQSQIWTRGSLYVSYELQSESAPSFYYAWISDGKDTARFIIKNKNEMKKFTLQKLEKVKGLKTYVPPRKDLFPQQEINCFA